MDVLAPEQLPERAERATEAPRSAQLALVQGNFTRRNFLGAAGAASLGLLLYAGEIARHDLAIERRAISIEHLPESFTGFRIVQISDFHYASYSEPAYIRHVVKRVNALKPDMILLTGDYISMSPLDKANAVDYAPLCATILGGLDCPLRYGVLGNHDWMVNASAVTESLRAVAIPILDNASVPLEREGKRIWIAGVADGLSQMIDLPKALPSSALADKEPVILMCHEPDLLDSVSRYGFDLMLSGHTHGGQVRMPFLPPYFLPPLGKRYVAGHFLRRRTQLYVNRGIGAVGLPFRLNCPPEITEITLHPA